MNNPGFERLAGKSRSSPPPASGKRPRAFAREGASVILVGRREAPLAATADAIRIGGGGAMVVTGDVSDADDVNAVITRTIDHFGRLDYLFNNAGIQGSGGPIVDTAEAASMG